MTDTLVHADYLDRVSVLVVKSPAGFRFRNPGLMRLPVAQVVHGVDEESMLQTARNLQKILPSVNLFIRK